MTAVVALLLCFLLPGIAGGVLLTWSSTDPARPGSLLLRGLSCGTAAWLIGSGLLARTIGITRTTAWVTETLLAVASIVVLLLPRSRRVLRTAGGEAAYFSGIVAVTVVAWLPVGLLVLKTTWGPTGSTPWYYWSLAQRVADTGHVPATTVEWGSTLPFLDDYRLMSTGTAMLLTQGGHFDVAAVQAVIVVSVLLVGCGAALLSNALGSGRIISLVAAAMAVATSIGALRLTSYRPEGLGIGLSLLTVACFVDWFRRDERTSLLAGCLVAVIAANVHGIALLAAVVMLVAAGLATLPWRGMRKHLLRLAASALVLVGCLLVSGLVLGGASGSTQVGDLANKSGLADPTWEFVRAITGNPPSLPPTNRQMAQDAATNVLQPAGAWLAAAAGVAALGIVIGLVTRQAAARRALVFTLITLLGIAGVGTFLALGWSSYVPRRTGAQRMVQEATLVITPFVACGTACLMFLLGRRAGQVWRRSVSAALVVLSCGLGVFYSARAETSMRYNRPLTSDVSALRGLDLPRNSVVLTNAYTEGYVAQVMGATGLLDGRAPYTYPDVLTRASRLLREAKTFYRRPCRNLGFLDENHVSYVVVTHPGSYALGTNNLFARAPGPQRLDACPGLTPVLNTRRLLVYRVER